MTGMEKMCESSLELKEEEYEGMFLAKCNTMLAAKRVKIAILREKIEQFASDSNVKKN